jgi:hypothetical protein
LWREAAKWFVGEIPFGKEVENVHESRNSFLNIKANIPVFHHSIIPGVGRERQTAAILFNFSKL